MSFWSSFRPFRFLLQPTTTLSPVEPTLENTTTKVPPEIVVDWELLTGGMRKAADPQVIAEVEANGQEARSDPKDLIIDSLGDQLRDARTRIALYEASENYPQIVARAELLKKEDDARRKSDMVSTSRSECVIVEENLRFFDEIERLKSENATLRGLVNRPAAKKKPAAKKRKTKPRK